MKQAFAAAESVLSVSPLLDPDDVVSAPDEKSVVTCNEHARSALQLDSSCVLILVDYHFQ